MVLDFMVTYGTEGCLDLASVIALEVADSFTAVAGFMAAIIEDLNIAVGFMVDTSVDFLDFEIFTVLANGTCADFDNAAGMTDTEADTEAVFTAGLTDTEAIFTDVTGTSADLDNAAGMTDMEACTEADMEAVFMGTAMEFMEDMTDTEAEEFKSAKGMMDTEAGTEVDTDTEAGTEVDTEAVFTAAGSMDTEADKGVGYSMEFFTEVGMSS